MSYKIRRDAADDAFSKWVRLRDMTCCRCGSRVQLNDKGMPITHQASHFMSRRKEATRFDPLNVDTLCGGCHTYFTSQPAEHYLWQVRRKGQQVVDDLILRSNQFQKKDRVAEKLYWRAELAGLVKVGQHRH